MKKYFLAFVLLLFAACDKNDDTNYVLSDDYFPLEIGNYWQFENSGKVEFSEIKTINSKSYFVLASANDTSYYRKENNKIYVIEYDEAEGIKFDLDALVNETWNYGEYIVKLQSKTDTININGHDITECYKFFFDIPECEDDEYILWLAPGIGFIQNYCGLCYNSYIKLDKAKIGDQIMDF